MNNGLTACEWMCSRFRITCCAILAASCGSGHAASSELGLESRRVEATVDRLGEARDFDLWIRNQGPEERTLDVIGVSCGCVSVKQTEATVPARGRKNLQLAVRPNVLHPKEHTVTLRCRETQQVLVAVVVSAAEQGVIVDPPAVTLRDPLQVGTTRLVGRILMALNGHLEPSNVSWETTPTTGNLEVVADLPRKIRQVGNVSVFEASIYLAGVRPGPKLDYDCSFRLCEGLWIHTAVMTVTAAVVEP